MSAFALRFTTCSSPSKTASFGPAEAAEAEEARHRAAEEEEEAGPVAAEEARHRAAEEAAAAAEVP